METKKQKIKRLKEIYIQIEQFMKEKNKQKKEVLVRIKELETMLKRSGEENKNSILLRLCETELEILNKEWWQAVDDRMKIRQQLKELGSIL